MKQYGLKSRLSVNGSGRIGNRSRKVYRELRNTLICDRGNNVGYPIGHFWGKRKDKCCDARTRECVDNQENCGQIKFNY